MGRIVERRVPERHDRVAHVFVDGAFAVDDGVGQRSEEAVHQRGQALRILLVDLRDRGEAADVAEHDRHLALFAAEHELFRRLRELLDQRRRKILAERRPDLPPLRLLLDEVGEHQREVDQQARQQREGEIDQQLLVREQYQDAPTSSAMIAAPNSSSRAGPRIGASQMIASPITNATRQFRGDGVIRRRQHRVGQDVFQHLRMDLDARHRRDRPAWSSGRAGPRPRCRSGQACAPRGRPARGLPARRRRRRSGRGRRGANCTQSWPLRSVGIVRPGSATLLMPARSIRIRIVLELGHHPQHLEGQRRHDVALRHHHHRHAPHDAVALGANAEQAAPGGGFFQHRDVSQQTREIEQERLRIAAERGDADGGRLACRAAALTSGRPVSPSTTRDCRMASAIT